MLRHLRTTGLTILLASPLLAVCVTETNTQMDAAYNTCNREQDQEEMNVCIMRTMGATEDAVKDFREDYKQRVEACQASRSSADPLGSTLDTDSCPTDFEDYATGQD